MRRFVGVSEVFVWRKTESLRLGDHKTTALMGSDPAHATLEDLEGDRVLLESWPDTLHRGRTFSTFTGNQTICVG